jgi:hypothetical protein
MPHLYRCCAPPRPRRRLVLLIVVYPLEQVVEPVWATDRHLLLARRYVVGAHLVVGGRRRLLLPGAPPSPTSALLSGGHLAFFALYVIFGILHGYADAFDGSRQPHGAAHPAGHLPLPDAAGGAGCGAQKRRLCRLTKTALPIADGDRVL